MHITLIHVRGQEGMCNGIGMCMMYYHYISVYTSIKEGEGGSLSPLLLNDMMYLLEVNHITCGDFPV